MRLSVTRLRSLNSTSNNIVLGLERFRIDAPVQGDLTFQNPLRVPLIATPIPNNHVAYWRYSEARVIQFTRITEPVSSVVIDVPPMPFILEMQFLGMRVLRPIDVTDGSPVYGFQALYEDTSTNTQSWNNPDSDQNAGQTRIGESVTRYLSFNTLYLAHRLHWSSEFRFPLFPPSWDDANVANPMIFQSHMVSNFRVFYARIDTESTNAVPNILRYMGHTHYPMENPHRRNTMEFIGMSFTATTESPDSIAGELPVRRFLFHAKNFTPIQSGTIRVIQRRLLA